MNSLIQGLQQALANTYVLTSLTQCAHWNVVGSDFFQLHDILGTQYAALFDLTDIIAERIRALSGVVPVSLAAFEVAANMSAISPSFSAAGMINALITAHVKNVVDLKSLAVTAREVGDTVTENIVLTWIESEEKTLWMLRAWAR